MFKSIVRPIVSWIYRYRAEAKLRKISQVTNPAVVRLADVIHDVLKYIIDSEESERIGRIEKMRDELSRSLSKISITDFGAGKPNDVRTEGQMQQGVANDFIVGEVCRRASKDCFWSLLLFKIIREFKPSTVIELGTCLGISAAYQATALKLNGMGMLVTLEGAKSLASLAEKNFKLLGLDNTRVIIGRFDDNLGRVFSENRPIDFAFIDGHHDEEATISYFEQFFPHLSSSSIIVFDDISWSKGMRNAWRRIEGDRRVKISFDLRAMGICVLDENIHEKHAFNIPIL